jgi:hypothetical protein
MEGGIPGADPEADRLGRAVAGKGLLPGAADQTSPLGLHNPCLDKTDVEALLTPKRDGEPDVDGRPTRHPPGSRSNLDGPGLCIGRARSHQQDRHKREECRNSQEQPHPVPGFRPSGRNSTCPGP